MILTAAQYKTLEIDAFDLLITYGFVKFPIDIFELAKKAFNVKFIKYSSLNPKQLIKVYECKLDAGFTVINHLSDGKCNYYIYYNDSYNICRQRYTIGHELKHIFYNEIETNEEQEAGAEYFSKCLLAPKCIIIKEKLKNDYEIAERFEISKESALNILIGIIKRRDYHDNTIFAHEKEFLNRIEELKSYQDIDNTFAVDNNSI